MPKSYKGFFPFKIGTTSYIYPDHILPNVICLGPYLDEIELLIFESEPDGFPTKSDFKILKKHSEEYSLTFNVHLPTDIYLGSNTIEKRRQAVRTILKIMDLTSCISPTTYTLHFAYDQPSQEKDNVIQWQDRIAESVTRLLAYGIPGKMISIETLSYPFHWVEKIISEFDLSVCIDLGHLLTWGVNAEHLYASFKEKVVILHLHGIDGDRDHISLDNLTRHQWDAVMCVLNKFHGVVSLEVFSYEHLVSSLRILEAHF